MPGQTSQPRAPDSSEQIRSEATFSVVLFVASIVFAVAVLEESRSTERVSTALTGVGWEKSKKTAKIPARRASKRRFLGIFGVFIGVFAPN